MRFFILIGVLLICGALDPDRKLSPSFTISVFLICTAGFIMDLIEYIHNLKK